MDEWAIQAIEKRGYTDVIHLFGRYFKAILRKEGVIIEYQQQDNRFLVYRFSEWASF
jgi:hypothetical protein